MKNIAIKLVFIACYAICLGSCGAASVPSVDDLISRDNVLRQCTNEQAISATQSQKDAIDQACSNNDKIELDKSINCSINVKCNNNGTEAACIAEAFQVSDACSTAFNTLFM